MVSIFKKLYFYRIAKTTSFFSKYLLSLLVHNSQYVINSDYAAKCTFMFNLKDYEQQL